MAAMQENDFRLKTQDGSTLFVRSFLPDAPPRAVVQISHGMAEHSERYGRLARVLVGHGYGVYASDHRGHGKTVTSQADLGTYAERDGWKKVVDDQISLIDEIKSRHPGAPVFLLGHSMGSFIARGVALKRGDALAGLLLSGTNHESPATLQVFRTIARVERRRLGRRAISKVINALAFESFNKRFTSPRTDFDWLSRDPAEVDKYVADPLCGFDCTTNLWVDLLQGLIEICTPELMARMPKTLPIYVLSGELDPVNNRLIGIRKLRKALEEIGMQNVKVRIYPGARHELFNETNRDEITNDLVAWLDEVLEGRQTVRFDAMSATSR
jgi:alpha-beta hydrolase superfamily lysophospholipase